jgi:hypothetical protein
MTVAMLERNLVRLYDNFHSPEARARAQATPKMAASTPVRAYHTTAMLRSVADGCECRQAVGVNARDVSLGVLAGAALGIAAARYWIYK